MSTRRPRSLTTASLTATPAVPPQRVDEAVRRGQADRQVEDVAADSALGIEELGRRSRAIGAQGYRGLGVPHPPDVLEPGPSLGIHLEMPGKGGVQDPARVGQHRIGYFHRLEEALELGHVRGLDPAGKDGEPVAPLARRLREVVDEGSGHRGEARDVAADVARRIRVEHDSPRRYLALRRRLPDDLRQIVPYRLGETGRVDGDDIRIVEGEDRVEGLEEIALSAEDRRPFGEGGGGGHDGFLVVPGQGAPMVGAAALRAVAMGQAAMHAQGRVHGSDGLAGLGGIYRQGLARRRFRPRVLQIRVRSTCPLLHQP